MPTLSWAVTIQFSMISMRMRDSISGFSFKTPIHNDKPNLMVPLERRRNGSRTKSATKAWSVPFARHNIVAALLNAVRNSLSVTCTLLWIRVSNSNNVPSMLVSRVSRGQLCGLSIACQYECLLDTRDVLTKCQIMINCWGILWRFGETVFLAGCVLSHKVGGGIDTKLIFSFDSTCEN